MAARDDSMMFVFLSTLSLRRATASQGADTGDKVFLSTLSLRRATHQTYQLNAKREFLSTLSLRRATLAGPSGPAFLFNFYPRSPCGERPVRVVRTCWSPYFYPRSPCGERHGQDVLLPAALEFLSTLSLRRATSLSLPSRAVRIISIHALLAESDKPATRRDNQHNVFLSTLSLRRAT